MDNKLESLSSARERKAAREVQTRAFRRNQSIGLLVIALAILAYRILHTPAGWLFPAGWWRLW